MFFHLSVEGVRAYEGLCYAAEVQVKAPVCACLEGSITGFSLNDSIFTLGVSVREIIHSYIGKMPHEASQEGSFLYNARCFITLWQATHALWLLFSLLHHFTDSREKKLFR